MGGEGAGKVLQNTPDYHMELKLYFTSEALKDYMKIAVPIHKGWDISHVGAKLEAFAVAGCDLVSESLGCLSHLDPTKNGSQICIVHLSSKLTT